jgi:hypothetical protein
MTLYICGLHAFGAVLTIANTILITTSLLILRRSNANRRAVEAARRAILDAVARK